MARPLRIEYENAFYHITSRGNERKDIFIDNKDNEKFLDYLGLMHQRYHIIVYCFVLMKNHYHLLIETPGPNLCRMMRDLNGHYTIYFNKRHKRSGHLLQGRYSAILIDKDSYLLELSRYIHLNPVRAELLSKPEDYKYSSMSYYIIGKDANTPWLNTNFILVQFGDSIEEQRAGYKRFVYEGLRRHIDNPLKNSYARSILGSESFIKEITHRFLSRKDISCQVPYAKSLKFGKELDDIAQGVMKCYNIDKESLIKRKAKFNNAKKVFIYLARRYADIDLKQISNYLNNTITDSGISKLFLRTQEKLMEEKDFKEEVERIEQQLFSDVHMSQVKT